MSLSLSELRQVRTRLERLHGDGPSVGLDEIRDVVVVASSSRGGSSMFMEMLRHAEGLLHLQAEINPFLVLAELSWPWSGSGSDRLDPSHLGEAAVRILQEELGREIGRRIRSDVDRSRLARDLCWRLTVQWPRIDFQPDQVSAWVAEVLDELGDEGQDLEALHLGLIRRVREHHDVVNPWFYDIDPRRIREAFPGLEEPTGPPGDVLLEESPFILAGAWQAPSARELVDKPLVIKTPSNAYRLDFLQALFPRARFRVLHLTRNPAAAINGLLDGWRFRGFHAHRMDEPLQVPGYSDLRPEDSYWWKYDLPPGWEAIRASPLQEICAHQWASAHEATLAFLSRSDCPRIQVHFEDLVGDEGSREEVFIRLFEWLGVEMDPWMSDVVKRGIPPVMATARPRHRRWYERAGLLEPIIAEPRIQALAHLLGYGEPDTWT
jgi:hypothetical protein